MTKLLVPLLWVVAAAIALCIVVSIRRGKPLVLRGYWSPRFVRMIAVLMVAMNAGCAAPETNDAPPANGNAPAMPAANTPSIPPSSETPVKLPGLLRTGDDSPTGMFATPGELPKDASALIDRFEITYHVSHTVEDYDSGWATFRVAMMAVEGGAISEETRTKTLKHAADQVEAVDNDFGMMLDHKGTVAPEHEEAFKGWRNALRAALLEDVARYDSAVPVKPSLAKLEVLLTALQDLTIYDAWYGGYLWRQAARAVSPDSDSDGAALARFYGRLHTYFRIQNAIAMTRFADARPDFRPWRSKASTPKLPGDWFTKPAGFARKLRNIYSKANAGVWDTQVLLTLSLEGGGQGLRVMRGGTDMALERLTLTLNRLDVLSLPAAATEPMRLEHSFLGTLTLQPGHWYSAWNLHETLSEDARARLTGLSNGAAQDDAAAVDLLEGVMLVAHHPLREAVAKSGDPAKGAAARLLLALFDN